jgi:hypothetical protein
MKWKACDSSYLLFCSSHPTYNLVKYLLHLSYSANQVSTLSNPVLSLMYVFFCSVLLSHISNWQRCLQEISSLKKIITKLMHRVGWAESNMCTKQNFNSADISCKMPFVCEMMLLMTWGTVLPLLLLIRIRAHILLILLVTYLIPDSSD